MSDNQDGKPIQVVSVTTEQLSSLKSDVYKNLQIRATATILVLTYTALLITVENASEILRNLTVYKLIVLLYLATNILVAVGFYMRNLRESVRYIGKCNTLIERGGSIVHLSYVDEEKYELSEYLEEVDEEVGRLGQLTGEMLHDTLIGGSAIVSVVVLLMIFVIPIEPVFLITSVLSATIVLVALRISHLSMKITIGGGSLAILLISIIQGAALWSGNLENQMLDLIYLVLFGVWLVTGVLYGIYDIRRRGTRLNWKLDS